MQNAFLERTIELNRAGQPFAVAIVVRAERPTSAKPGAKAIVTADGALTGLVGGSCAQPTVVREALKALQDGEPRLVRLCPPEKLGAAPREGVVEVALTCVSGGTLEVYIEPHLPRQHLVVVGHLPIAEALSRLGRVLDYDVTVMGLDVTADRFPDADRILDRLDFSALNLTAQAFVVVATHGNYDEDALEGALRSDAAYVALVASRALAEAIQQYLRESGLSAEALARLKIPAGLDLGAVTPEEIALSILAEIVQLRRHPSANSISPLFKTPPVVQPLEATDLVCGMMVDIATARYTSHYGGQVYYFCSAGCQRSFEKQPESYLKIQNPKEQNPNGE